MGIHLRDISLGSNGLEADFTMEVAIVVVSVAIFATSVWLGLKKGIKRLSDFNIWLAFVLLAFVLIAGPTVFLLKTSVNSLGLMAQNFVRMNSWTDAFSGSGFVQNWTAFYWAWWIAYAPFVGLFYMIFGNFGLYLEMQGTVEVTRVMTRSAGTGFSGPWPLQFYQSPSCLLAG